ncbi:hypothetical protein UlMin_022613 [Ulmus minor]
MVSSDSAIVVARLKREQCSRTKHDRDFSKWEILVGPDDWEDYSLGKEGAERYRVHNLPKSSSPGVYELGVAVSRTGLGREIGKLDPNSIVVVYLGQAENVRARLQHYGRTGAHLGNSNLSGLPTECTIPALQKGPGLFEEILSGGHPIVFRWASMQSKSDAIKTETSLLNIFDYAWNTSINGPRRPNDILQKLDKISSSSTQFSDITRKFLPFRQKKVGIKIKSSNLLSTENKTGTCPEEESHSFLPQVFKVGRSQPRLVVERKNTIICGVVSDDGSVCRTPPVEGRKRCVDHKGMKIKGSIKIQISNSDFPSQLPIRSHDTQELPLFRVNSSLSESFTPACGFILVDGSPCTRQPLRGNKRCSDHKGRRIC